ncbi:LOW QUALITY PROTEIN: toll-like receptor 13 [Rhinatrema bivittatum]|uniref:LOW QUALITY PROTEIN: toll-like receptor 13 n=1 Tax=Rhinatrema bivittatum TaxID=194408 RepID=UPI00112C03A5|nr:LOW QUALITY PROTEIN: toll-like receptor 13 [Rhinatrema bivittatum]
MHTCKKSGFFISLTNEFKSSKECLRMAAGAPGRRRLSAAAAPALPLSFSVSFRKAGAMLPPRVVPALLLLLLLAAGPARPYSVPGCEVHATKVLCYRRGLRAVPARLPQALLGLDLSGNELSALRPEAFRPLRRLQVLNVSANRIGSIQEGTFARAGGLQLLNLTANRLAVLAPGMLEGLGNLSTLLLSHNQIAAIQPAAFQSLGKLRRLHLASNKLQTLRALSSAFQIQSLVELHIGDNGLQSFSTEDIIQVSSALRDLDISRNPFSRIQVVTDALQNLTSLNLSFVGNAPAALVWFLQDSCFLKSLRTLYLGGIHMKPQATADLLQTLSCTSLEEVHLNHLNLTDSDNLIGQLCSWHPTVKVLNLQGNEFTALKEDVFGNCTTLQQLDLSLNKFTVVPTFSFMHLDSLQHLSLAGNQLADVPAAISQVMTLESLDLSSNNIGKIGLKDFEPLSNLKNLNLANNRIEKINSSFHFQGLHSLQELKLGNNILLEISDSLSPNLKMLQLLELRVNKLSLIKAKTFQYLSSLLFLNLVDNQIETIEPGAFDGLIHLQTLLLGSNKITSATFQENTFRGLSSLKEIQLFDNYISYKSSEKLDPPPFLLLKSLETITFNSQGHRGMLYFPSNFLEGLVSVEKIHAGNLAIDTLDVTVFSYTPKLKELDVSYNVFSSINPALLQHVPNLTELHMTKLGLQTLDFVFGVNLSQLLILRAAGNQLNILERRHLAALPSLTFLDLRRNPLTCDCDNQWFLCWALNDTKTQVIHFYDYTCAYPPSSKGKKLSTFNTSSCTVDYEFILFISTLTAVTFMMTVCTFYHLWRWQVVCAYYLFLAFLYDKKQKRKPNYMQQKYDAFISYNKHDEEWVIYDLLPKLEDYYKWKLCLHHRDFEPGKPILDNLVENIYASRKTICIISHHYLASEWCSREMQIASFRLFDEQKDVLVLIFLEEIPSYRLSPYHRMRKLVKKKTYLMWPRDKEAEPLFWHKLNLALKTSEGKEEENQILSESILENDD